MLLDREPRPRGDAGRKEAILPAVGQSSRGADFHNRKDANGARSCAGQEIPFTGRFGDFEPRNSFGKQSPAYVLAGAPPGSTRASWSPRAA